MGRRQAQSSVMHFSRDEITKKASPTHMSRNFWSELDQVKLISGYIEHNKSNGISS